MGLPGAGRDPAGVLGAAYNTHGPSLVIYGTLRRWSATQFRATPQAYFLPVGCCLLVAHAVAELWTPTVLRYYGWSLPAVVVAMVIGGRINRFFEPQRFLRAVHGLLAIIGVGLLIDVIMAFR